MMTAPLNSRPIRVALVEDDVNFQNALAQSIAGSADITLEHIVATRAAALRCLEGAAVDVLLVDLGLPDGSGIDVIRRAQMRWPRCGVMVSTVFGDEDHVIRSIEAGATGYLLKDSEPEEMLEEIRSLAAGGSPISPLIARQILTRFRNAVPLQVAPPPGLAVERRVQGVLSAREQQALEYITKGFTADEIAKLMQVSPHTVLTYVRRIYGKLEVKSRTEAVFEARQRGILG
jgi:DNA-binding NarL/FixJ family response regulator